jgi:hypothetical protein
MDRINKINRMQKFGRESEVKERLTYLSLLCADLLVARLQENKPVCSGLRFLG